MSGDDPFTGIATAPPRLRAEQAVEIAQRNYGIDVEAVPLVSERDQNFRLTAGDGRRFVLKVANASEDRQVTDFQIRALLHIARNNADGIAVPMIIPTVDGSTEIVVDAGGSEHVTRLVTYLPGEPMTPARLDEAVSRELGVYLARLDRTLADFSHPGENQVLLWDMKRAAELRALLPHVGDAGQRALVEQTLDEFEAFALPAFDGLRAQVIHNDANPDNVLLAADGEAAIVGIIDFGDMLRSPLIVELAVAAAYMRAMQGNPLALIVELLTGYHSVTPLMRAEVDILHELIRMRLATTVLILCWRETLRGSDDAYLQAATGSESTALGFLQRLAEIPRRNAQQIYSQVCASVTNGTFP